jgi:hypothetical protein
MAWRNHLREKPSRTEKVFISIFRDEGGAFEEAAGYIKRIYAQYCEPENIKINRLQAVNLDRHEDLVKGSTGLTKYIIHYVGHGQNLIGKQYPEVEIDDKLIDLVEHAQYICKGNNIQSSIVVFDCCNQVPGEVHPDHQRRYPGIQLLLEAPGNNIICSSKRGLYSYYFPQRTTLFTIAFLECCAGAYETISDLLTHLNRCLLQLYMQNELVVDDSGKIIWSTWTFNKASVPKALPGKILIMKDAVNSLIVDPESSVPILTMKGVPLQSSNSISDTGSPKLTASFLNDSYGLVQETDKENPA